MRAIWSGSISFGLVNIPVNLYSGVNPKNLDLDMIHETDLCPIRYKRVCKETDEEVPYDEIVKGFKHDSEYVVITDEDFRKADVKKAKSIEIVDFVKEDEVDSIYFEKPYYLEPIKGSEKAYSLLREALRKSNKTGIAKFVIRNREHLGLIKPEGNIILLEQMRFNDEIRKTDELQIPDELTTEKELEMALTLINQLSHPFNPEDYKDTYIERLKEIIEEKAKGIEPKQRGKEPRPTDVKDLLSTLKASLEKERQRQMATA